MKNKNKIILILIFVLALLLRLYKLDWDQGQHLHPDERFLTMYITDTKLPSSFSNYLTSLSSLNPYNLPAYKFFVYGTLPTTITKLIGHLLNLNSYSNIHLLGRGLSALLDSLNIFLLFLIFKLISKDSSKSFLPPLIYATTVLPLQLSHFFAVDTFLNFFLFALFTSLVYWLYRQRPIYLILSALSFAAALSSKISAIIFCPVILVIFILYFFKTKSIKKFFISLSLFTVPVILATRVFSPYYFDRLSFNQAFIDSLLALKNLNTIYFPPAIQWFSKTKFVFPIQNLIFWSLGLPFSLFFLYSHFKKSKTHPTSIRLLWLWSIVLFVFQSAQFSYTLRYYLVIIPSLIIISSYKLISLKPKLVKIYFFCHFFYLISFLNIYHLPHSRLQASNWIYQNVVPKSVISCDHWDDCLPLPLSGNNSSIYQTDTLHLFDQDSSQKWLQITNQLNKIDYIIMSSNRLWASIPKVPNLFPQTSLFYQQLFSGQTVLDTNISFSKVAQFDNYPGFYLPFFNKCIYIGKSNYPGVKNKFIQIDPNCFYPGFYFRDDTADEAFTVYDHPQVLIFKKNNQN